jgi:hypothetical protein
MSMAGNGTSIPPEILDAVRRIEIRTRRLVQEVFSGEYHSVFKGTGMEFREVREYVPGDDVRTIDWNVTARTDEPFVKLFEEERELTVILAVDMSRSGWFGSRAKTKIDIATELCGVLAFSAISNKDKVGLVMFSDQVEKYIPPAKGKSHVLRIIRELLTFTPEGSGTDFNEPLKLLGSVLKRKATVFLVSDYWTSGYATRLSILARKHDLVAVRVRGNTCWIPRPRQLPGSWSIGPRCWMRNWKSFWPARVWTSWISIAPRATWSLCASSSWSARAARPAGGADDEGVAGPTRPFSGPGGGRFGCRSSAAHARQRSADACGNARAG